MDIFADSIHMLRKMGIFLFFVSLFLGCQKQMKTSSFLRNSLEVFSFFGPIVMPADCFFRSFTVTYQTPTPEKTMLTFTMTGDIDWYLERPSLSTIHQVTFEDVEEEVSYSFLPRNFPSNAITTISTPPFSPSTPFVFAVMRTDGLWTNEVYPAFTIVIKSGQESAEKTFFQFYQSNRYLAHHSILCPVFGIQLQDKILSEEKPWYWFSYGKAIVLVLKHRLPLEPLYLYLSQEKERENFIVAVDFDDKEWKNLLMYHKVAHLIRFSFGVESLIIRVSTNVTTFYSYKR